MGGGKITKPIGEDDFVQLDRTFHELSSYASESDDIDLLQAFHVGGRLAWADVLSNFRTIIVAEAGAGKTEELLNAARQLAEQGKPAFFLRLEYIKDDFALAFEPGDFARFEEWLSGQDEGWVFLDSVDEARLKGPGDFEFAIRKVGRASSAAYDRAHVIISGRIGAWRPKTDLQHCEQNFPYTPPHIEVVTEDVVDGDEGEPEYENGWDEETDPILTTRKADKAPDSFFKIMTLDDLSGDQIEKFAEASGIEDSKAFLDAVERADAWSFTTRPQDLKDLTAYWRENQKIGTRLDVTNNSISRRLMERDKVRAEAMSLKDMQARKGARLLAAAVTLTKDSTIRLPDGAENTKGLATEILLPEWEEVERSALLTRPIFDEAIYGTVRFHHRRSREFLTAEWLLELLSQNTSRRAVEDLLFREQYGVWVVVPTMRPIIPWLAIKDERVRERVRQIAPEVLLEGGDPASLPAALRTSILREVSSQIARGEESRAIHQLDVVQRFAGADIAEDVRQLLREHRDDEDLCAFLLRMVWQGELVDALPEVREIAFTANAPRYVRIAAIRALTAVGTDDDLEALRTQFLDEQDVLNRDWLKELVDTCEPSEGTVRWLIQALRKVGEIGRYEVDHLGEAIVEFLRKAGKELLGPLADEFNALLDTPPLEDSHFSLISIRYGWLLGAAGILVHRCIEQRDEVILSDSVLGILWKIGMASRHGTHRGDVDAAPLERLIVGWPTLNRALFWFGVERTREIASARGEGPITEAWQAAFYGGMWEFSADDFDYFVEQMRTCDVPADRLVALSVAFDLYRLNGRPRRWREALKKAAEGDAEVNERRSRYLRPTASPDHRRWKDMERKQKRRQEEASAKRKQHHQDWKEYLLKNVDAMRARQATSPAVMTNGMRYLYDQARSEKSNNSRWTAYNWQSLIPKFGEPVARFYRDATVGFWRHSTPELISEGAPANQTSFSSIFGLVGLEIEAHETPNWPRDLSTDEVVLACRYALQELNGFPTWMPKLFEYHPEAVTAFLMSELEFELSNDAEDSDRNYLLSDIAWSGQWAWDRLGPQLLTRIESNEPHNLRNLGYLLKIIQGSSLSDEDIARVCKLKCADNLTLDHFSSWLAVWMGTDADIALPELRSKFDSLPDQETKTDFAMKFITKLVGHRSSDGVNTRQSFHTARHLQALYLLMNAHISPREDIDRTGGGVFTPGLRDNAQDARNMLFELLQKIPGREGYDALRSIADAFPDRPWLRRLLRGRVEADADLSAWTAEQVRDFNNGLVNTPGNHQELARLALLRFEDLKDDLEQGDNSLAKLLLNQDEVTVRNYLGRELRNTAQGRYSVVQEEELADGKRPDLRFNGVGFDGPVPVELKLADASHWSGPKLFERMETQLTGDYLRDQRSARGLFVLVNQGKKGHWETPSGQRVGFDELVEALRAHWTSISPSYPNVEDISVVGIDLTKREHRKTKQDHHS